MRSKKAIQAKDHYARHKEELRAKQRAYYAKHALTICQRKRRHRQEQSIKIKEQDRKKYERTKEKKKEYYEMNRERILRKQKDYRQKNRERHALHSQRRRLRKRQQGTGDFTVEQWREMKAIFKYRCVYCGKKTIALTMDHITPISKGGLHTLSNIVPACQSCNSKKHVNPPFVPVQPLMLL